MHESVRDIFIEFTTKFEGRVSHMYLDKKRYVTVGIGKKIDPMPIALPLPFLRKDNRVATHDEIIFEWRMMKLNIHLAEAGAGAAGKMATLHLRDTSIDRLVYESFDANANELVRWLPKLEDYSADAQLALSSMAYAMGAGFLKKFPKFWRLIVAGRFADASKECLMRTTDNPGLIPRNKANVKLFLAAQACIDGHIDASILRGWP